MHSALGDQQHQHAHAGSDATHSAVWGHHTAHSTHNLPITHNKHAHLNNVLLQIQLLLVVVIAHVAEALQDLLENSEGHHLNAFDRAALVADRCRVAAQSYQLVEDVVEKQVLWVM